MTIPNTGIKYFPFASEIPYQTTTNNKITNKIAQNIWGTVLADRNAAVCCFGGLFESYFSLVFIEAISYLTPSKTIYWLGNKEYYDLIKLQGLAIPHDNGVDQLTLDQYPVPIFLDEKDYFYYNVLNNVFPANKFIRKNIKKYVISNVGRSAGYRILDNLTFSYKDDFRPKLRKYKDDKFLQWAEKVNLDLKRPMVCVFPDKHQRKFCPHLLGWEGSQVKGLVEVMRQIGGVVLVFSKEPEKYRTAFGYYPPFDLNMMVGALRRAELILADECDYFVLAGMENSEIKMLFKWRKRSVWDPTRNLKMLGVVPKTYQATYVYPKDILEVFK